MPYPMSPQGPGMYPPGPVVPPKQKGFLGTGISPLGVAALAGAGYLAYKNKDAFMQGFHDGYNGYQAPNGGSVAGAAAAPAPQSGTTTPQTPNGGGHVPPTAPVTGSVAPAQQGTAGKSNNAPGGGSVPQPEEMTAERFRTMDLPENHRLAHLNGYRKDAQTSVDAAKKNLQNAINSGNTGDINRYQAELTAAQSRLNSLNDGIEKNRFKEAKETVDNMIANGQPVPEYLQQFVSTSRFRDDSTPNEYDRSTDEVRDLVQGLQDGTQSLTVHHVAGSGLPDWDIASYLNGAAN